MRNKSWLVENSRIEIVAIESRCYRLRDGKVIMQSKQLGILGRRAEIMAYAKCGGLCLLFVNELVNDVSPRAVTGMILRPKNEPNVRSVGCSVDKTKGGEVAQLE